MKTLRPATFCFLLAVLLSALSSPAIAQDTAPMPDWDKARAEAVEILSGLVRIDTSNPPGNETKAAEFIKSILDREGIQSQIYELEPGRGNIVARLKGNGKKRPILLMGHIDVVGVEREKWTVDPFAAVIKDGYLYGRGASDDKGMTSVCLEVFLMLHRLKTSLDRDVIFLAEAGEEGTSRAGIDFMVDRHWPEIECEFALNEGGVIYERDGGVRYVGVSTTEKVPRGIRLLAKGTSGHGSMPRLDNAITHLGAAVAKVGSYQMPMRLNETTRTFFARLASISPPEESKLYRALLDAKESEAAQERLRAANIGYNSMLRTSLVPTIIKGGFRSNVIPGDAEATFDVRALPDEDISAMIATLKKLINDPAIEIVPPPQRGRPASPPSGINTEMFQALERAQKAMFPKAVTLPMMLTGATDSAQLRAKGVQAYGLGSVVTDEERSRIHGNDERLSIAGVGKFVEFVYRTVTDIAAAK
ncbi:MAG TPA: M20/M25/M40 family metallo-hydrolase [Blastocatellia bacterium]|nr:M20/M25/M40 family metallo-hydrolase [Blastocatellia bacterium]